MLMHVTSWISQRAGATVVAWFVGILLPSVAVSQETLKWTSVDGKEVAGEFMRMDSGSVVLKLASGKETKVPLSKLSLPSHLQALKLAKPSAFSKPLPKAPEKIAPVVLPETPKVTSIVDSPFGTDSSIDQFLSIAVNEWKNGNNFIVWHMLSPKIQQDLVAIYGGSMKSLGSSSQQQLQALYAQMASMLSSKGEWVLNSPLKGIIANSADPSDSKELVALVSGLLQKAVEPSRWQPNNFESNGVVQWLASNSELIGFARKAAPGLDSISYAVLSQTADSAEVEFKVGDNEPITVSFQKLDGKWVAAETVKQLDALVAIERNNQNYSNKLKGLVGISGIALPILQILDKAKSQDEFSETFAGNPMLKMLTEAPPSQDGDAARPKLLDLTSGQILGVPCIPGLPDLIAGPERMAEVMF